MRWYIWVLGLVVVIGAGGYAYVQKRLNAPMMMGEEKMASLRADVAAQKEDTFSRPANQPAVYQDPNPMKNVYFGDLHLHSSLSFDSYIFGNRLGVDEAYKVAKGKVVENPIGEKMQLTRPLDFAAVTDHAEGFGLHEGCAAPGLGTDAIEFCKSLESPSARLFLELRRQGEKRPPVSSMEVISKNAEEAQALANSTWSSIKEAADRHYEPGKFTTFAAYEYSPPLADSGKHHRNILFRNMETPDYAVSAFHALSEIDLWKQLEATCKGDCEFLTIPHNPNKTWGLAFASETIDGIPYKEEDWALRERSEPIVEMFQIKGNSECSLGFGATDEECGFEQFFPPCAEGQKTLCIFPTSMVRDGLKKGLALEDEIGINPLQFGFIGSTDTHNSNPGDTEEWDFRGASSLFTAPAKKRLADGRGGSRVSVQRNPGGLAAIWAPDNTRDDLFDAMQAKEVYATSGTRIRLRTFGGFAYGKALLTSNDALSLAYNGGVPMGGALQAEEGAPSFFLWAVRDPDGAPLDKIQIIKGWMEEGEKKEQVFDVLCSDGRTPDPATHRCAATSAKVDLSNCAFDRNKGASELKALWMDENYQSNQDAFYYSRVVQNPTCRWTTYDSLRIGQAPPADVPATSTEMAWSSPIWIKAQ
jgi:uncharacterized protein DUF3604